MRIRPGSLDADIAPNSEEPNDLIGLLDAHPGIHAICFNGKKAAQAFHRHVRAEFPLAGPRYATYSIQKWITRVSLGTISGGSRPITPTPLTRHQTAARL